MRTSPPRLATIALGAALLTLAASSAVTAPARHFELRRSLPAADTVLPTPPARVQLWFSEAPQLEGARIRVLDAAGELVATGPTAAVPDTATSLRAPVTGPLPAGRYVVHWRAMARDGHVVTGEIPFTVASAGVQSGR